MNSLTSPAVRLYHGDCLTVLAGLAESTIDSIVCDPPYGLTQNKRGGSGPASLNLASPAGRSRVTTGGGFMGKEWDAGVPGPEYWAAVLRVAKPGAHLLAFGGTRTFHRLACAIEDAGWEIRDTLIWVYGQGFPKSLNTGCNCRDSVVPYTHEQGQQEAKRDVYLVRDADVSQTVGISKGRGEVLQQGLSEPGTSPKGWQQLSTAKVRSGQSSVEGRGDVLAQGWQLQADQVREMSSGVSSNGSAGRIYHGTSADNGASHGKAPGTNGSSTSHQSRSARQPDREPGAIQQQQRTQAGGVGAVEVCATCGKLKGREGWGTSLKPSFEPVIMARKPFKGTVAANVLEWGTGAINVDASRVEADWQNDPSARGFGYGWNGSKDDQQIYKDRANGDWGMKAQDETWKPTAGRWPPNLLHDGSDEVTACFPVTQVGGAPQGSTNRNLAFGHGAFPTAYHGNDTGSAARFFPALGYDEDDATRLIDARCAICGLLSIAKHGIMIAEDIPCSNNASSVGKTSSLETTTIANGFVATSVQQNGQHDSAAKLEQLTRNAQPAVNGSKPSPATTGAIAPMNADSRRLEQLAHNVKCAGNLCGSCATAIAQSIVQMQRGQDPASTLGQVSISEHKRQILTQCLASFVALLGSTDTIPTTDSLSLLFGSVFHAIDNSIGITSGLTANETDLTRVRYVSKASKRDRDEGCEGLEGRVRLREDLTTEQREYVMAELKRHGVRL